MIVQVQFEAISVYMQAHHMHRAIPALQQMRDPDNKELMDAIAKDDDEEQLPIKQKYYWPFALLRVGE